MTWLGGVLDTNFTGGGFWKKGSPIYLEKKGGLLTLYCLIGIYEIGYSKQIG